MAADVVLTASFETSLNFKLKKWGGGGGGGGSRVCFETSLNFKLKKWGGGFSCLFRRTEPRLYSINPYNVSRVIVTIAG